jgi:rRNA maturation protein Nop10
MATERPCVDCGEPTLNDKRCRDCDIEYVLEHQHCPHCGWFCSRLNPGVFGPGQHGGSDLSCPVIAL